MTRCLRGCGAEAAPGRMDGKGMLMLRAFATLAQGGIPRDLPIPDPERPPLPDPAPDPGPDQGPEPGLPQARRT